MRDFTQNIYLSQVLDRLCLAGTSGPSRGATQVEMQGTGQCEVAPVSERGDDQSRGAAQVLIAILEGCVRLVHQAVVGGLVPLIAQLSVQQSVW